LSIDCFNTPAGGFVAPKVTVRHDSATRRGTPYGLAVGGVRIDDPELARRLVLHEARAQQGPSRELRDLGDAWLLHDTNDAEPFWNRVIAPRLPAEPAAFDRRLDEVITLFATLNRLPHVRPLPLGGEPADLPRRLEAAGFEWLGADRRMVLVEPERAGERLAGAEARVAAAFGGERVTVTRHGRDLAPAGERQRWADRRRSAGEASLVLEDAFGVDPGRRVALENDVLACVSRPGCSILLIRVDGEPAAIARRAETGDGSYLSSIGTRPQFRRRGLSSLATALLVADALEVASPVVHLSVEVDNDPGLRLYETLGFAVIGEPAPDLLLR
jgi:ribosomal protein S18 acetylase RimI-like enzyme